MSDLHAIYDDKVFLWRQMQNTPMKTDMVMLAPMAERSHEGIDLMTDMDVPIISVCDGVIEKAAGMN